MMKCCVTNWRLGRLCLPLLFVFSIIFLSIDSYGQISSPVSGDVTYGTDGSTTTINYNLTISNGGTLEIWGDLVCNGTLTIQNGGALIVHGNLTSSNSLSISGNVVVVGDVINNNNSSLSISQSGNIVIQGDLDIQNSGSISIDGGNTDNIYLIGDDSEVEYDEWDYYWNSNNYRNNINDLITWDNYNYSWYYGDSDSGDSEDLSNNESNNTALQDLLDEAGISITKNGDYKSNSTSNWSSMSSGGGPNKKYTWQRYNNGSWNNEANNDPGENSNVSTVTIQSGNTITVDVNRPSNNYAIENLVVDGTLAYVNNNSRSLTLTGSLSGAGTVNMTGGSRAHNLIVAGDFLPGTFNAGSGTVYLNGSSTQNVGGFTYNNLIVSGGGDKVLNGNTIINGALTLNGAKIILGDYDLILAEGASITGTYSSTNMIVTSGTGRLIKQGSANSDYQMVYPVGTDSYYTPYEITSITCSDADGELEVRAVSGTATGAETTDLQKYWEITQTGLTVSSASISFTYDNAEVGSGGDQTSYALQVYTGGAWAIPTGSSKQGVNPMTATVTGITGIWTARETPAASVPYTEDFEDADDLDEWDYSTTNTNHWYIGTPSNIYSNTSSSFAFITNDGGNSAKWTTVSADEDDDLELAIDFRGYRAVTLKFSYQCYGEGSNAYGCVYLTDSNNNDHALTPSGQTNSRISNSDVSSWHDITYVIPTAYVGQIVTLKFRWHCNSNAIATGNQPGFCVDDINFTGILADPTSFSAAASTDNTSSDIDLSWTANSANDTVIIVQSNSDNLGSVTPGDEGKVYTVDDEMATGVVVIYKGTAGEFTDTPLKYGTDYYYKAWSTRNGAYSDGVTYNATTNAKTATAEFLNETWEDETTSGNWATWSGSYPAVWCDDTGTLSYSTASADADRDHWLSYGTDQSNNSDHSAYITYDADNNDADDDGAVYNAEYGTQIRTILYCKVDLKGYTGDECNLIFDWLCNGTSSVDGHSNDAYGRVFIQEVNASDALNSINPNNGSHEYFGGITTGYNGANRYYGTTEWTTESFDMSSYIGKTVILGFEWNQSGLFDQYYYHYDGSSFTEGDLVPSFSVDNIMITNASSTVAIKKISSDESIGYEDNTKEKADEVVSISFTDKTRSNSSDNYSTKITKFEITPGAENSESLSDWRDAIAGVELRDGSTVVAEGVVNSNRIAFTFDDAIEVEDGNTNNYQMYIWLKNDLSDKGIRGGAKFDFAIDIDDIYTEYYSDAFIGESVSSGSIPIIEESQWLGYTQDWTKGSNWSKADSWASDVPGEEDDVFIPKDPIGGYYPVITSTNDVEVNNLEILSDASLTVSSGAMVTINGDLTTNGGLQINHTLDNPASLLVNGTITGKATVNLTDNFTYKKYRLLGVTADGVSMTEIDKSYPSGYYMYQYKSNAWSILSDTYDGFDDNPMRGYYLGSRGDGENLSYTGDFHNDDSYSHTSPIRKWQLVCNPYPCYIDITSSGFTLDGNCEQAVYVRRSSDNEVQTYWLDNTTPVSVNSASKLLAPGQGFWVWAEVSGAKITITKDARTNSGGTVGFKSASASSDVLRLSMTNGTLEDETVVVFRSDGAESYTSSDIDKMTNSGTNINFYSLKDKEDLVINLMPELYDGEVIPLGYSLSNSDEATYTIKLSGISFDGYDVYLDDLEEGISIDLKEKEEYSFISSESSDGRFQIRIASSESTEDETTTGIDDATISDDISVYSSGQTAYVAVGEEWMLSNSRMIYVYDVAGQFVKTVDLEDLETQFALPGEGVYLIKVVSGSMIYTEKVLGE